jgi:hypothetical protein
MGAKIVKNHDFFSIVKRHNLAATRFKQNEITGFAYFGAVAEKMPVAFPEKHISVVHQI